MENIESATIQHYWDTAVKLNEVSPELSASMLREMMEELREERKDIPPYFKKMFCFKCFSLFHLGENCQVTIGGNSKHPNIKYIEYNCSKCKNIQRINVQRSKEAPKPIPPPTKQQNPKQNQKNDRKRKIMMSIFQ
ncbi:hypothetical protein TVAG_088080 [Trichomonas vaginalis G3]|uniref:RNAse P Rpr2/Rpp21 subunit domain containing protein n=1 Tax=Trichomonas vaginalis (strain ATCC PRA-98 / G3) TaxID=412133 RepID=A2F5K0_TRIV3|nr:ribonuclease P subunit P21 family [Trichomonas vaginalis G3]EAX99826.1 hypothetical protein TVAG_088080 [Trichomonas vaginalis G3]KAI5517807.1 ribonuclease P subunit P21 family [Trichomonas vaginalis G3]|eukprot:XP_001312756.1 hypothetical protein [Trichomonas vaginalis G3]